ncbi:large conductance mechanosensitive channel protein MscL [Moheibacter sp.]|uniref:large conductance mechanosensitive channel protein MscL n=1 Tax=Moheibacter sp. TaxID=1965316 RepID=UPI003C768033
MGMVKEFKEFAFKGNVIDLAVGVIIGAAFGAIISSAVDDVITPLILTPVMEASGVENLELLEWNGVKYGNFLSAIIKFLMIAFVLFFLIKGANKLNKKEEAAPAGPSNEEVLLTEIRDILKNK